MKKKVSYDDLGSPQNLFCYLPEDYVPRKLLCGGGAGLFFGDTLFAQKLPLLRFGGLTPTFSTMNLSFYLRKNEPTVGKRQSRFPDKM